MELKINLSIALSPSTLQQIERIAAVFTNELGSVERKIMSKLEDDEKSLDAKFEAIKTAIADGVAQNQTAFAAASDRTTAELERLMALINAKTDAAGIDLTDENAVADGVLESIKSSFSEQAKALDTMLPESVQEPPVPSDSPAQSGV